MFVDIINGLSFLLSSPQSTLVFIFIAVIFFLLYISPPLSDTNARGQSQV